MRQSCAGLPDCSLSRKPLWRVPYRPLHQEPRPDIAIALGGGYANTELRRLADSRVFDYVDFMSPSTTVNGHCFR